MATKETKAVEEPLAPRIHINEFVALYTDLDDVQKAGFRAYAKKEWMRKDEWQDCLTEYTK